MSERPLRLGVQYLLAPRDFRLPRIWSNRELRRLAPLFSGDVINVSAWRDEDKEGERYRRYFSGAAHYYTSNYDPVPGSAAPADFLLDLEQPLAPELCSRFDVVFNHTTLEHVFDVFTAIGNLCAMSRDVVIVVVPFIQRVHTEASFSDYWRFTPHALRRLFERSGLSVVYFSSTPVSGASVYHLCVAVRDEKRWSRELGRFQASSNAGEGISRATAIGRAGRAILRRIGVGARFPRG
jgi:hypothetical protein